MADAIWRLASRTPSRAGLMTDEMENDDWLGQTVVSDRALESTHINYSRNMIDHRVGCNFCPTEIWIFIE